jgi:molybdopterin/thiamine biosynthesis adenylyltransferase
MQIKLRISSPVWEHLKRYHLNPSKKAERLSYIWARAYGDKKGNTTIIIPHNAPTVFFADDCYTTQSGGNVRLSNKVLNAMLVQFAASDYNALINIHDHWFDNTTQFSPIDNSDDMCFDKYLRQRFERMLFDNPRIGPSRSILNISLVLAKNGCDVRLVDTRQKAIFTRLTSVDIIGNHPERVFQGNTCSSLRIPDRGIFNRQTDFISKKYQDLMYWLTVCLIGCGGLGSILSESLARIGFGSLILIDDDTLETSNLNRFQGATPAMVGKPKAQSIARRLRRMFPALKVKCVSRSLYSHQAETAIRSSDIIVAGVDNDSARYCLNRAALQYNLPYFDAATAVSLKKGITDFLTRYFAVIPGVTACLECTQYTLINRQEAIKAFTDPATLASMRQAGYVIDNKEISAPSVYSLNLRSASLLTTELLNYICAFRPTATIISESWKEGRFQRSDRANFPETPHPECPICNYYAGAATTEPLPQPKESHLNNAAYFFSTHPQ